MASDKAIKQTSQDQADDVQTSIRIPLDVYTAVKHELAERGPGATAQDLWIEAMRKFLKLPSPKKEAA
jgi:hypothetical protein